jgi:hypothetical protein
MAKAPTLFPLRAAGAEGISAERVEIEPQAPAKSSPPKPRRVARCTKGVERAVESRLITEAETAHLLGMAASTFSREAAKLEADLGMPRRHPMLRKRDRVALHIWLDQVFSVDRKPATASELVRKRMAELTNG